MDLIVFVILTLSFRHVIGNKTPSNIKDYSDAEYCGVVEHIAGDVRTFAPWTAAIYLRNGKDGKVMFFGTGMLASPLHVAAYFRGFFVSSNSSSAAYRLPRPQDFLIGFGLNSTNIRRSKDEFSQFLEVEHVEPYYGPLEEYQQFHVIFLRLRERIKLTPYVRPQCFVTTLSQHQAEYDKLRLSYPANVRSNLTGFTYPKIDGDADLTTISILSQPRSYCQAKYELYYGSQLPPGFSCAKTLYSEGDDNVRCVQHNSPRVDRVFGDKFYGTGVVAIIPDRKRNICTKDTLYFIYISSIHEKSWGQELLACTNKFSCSKDKTCLEWDKVCDSVADCDSQQDEDTRLCKAWNA